MFNRQSNRLFVAGKKFCNYWLHNGFITINDEKMSKSVQNFKTVRYYLTYDRD